MAWITRLVVIMILTNGGENKGLATSSREMKKVMSVKRERDRHNFQ